METEYLIIGNSAGGIGAAEALREVDAHGAVTIVADEPYPAYSRPMISKYLAHQATLEKMLFRPQGFYEKNSITALLGRKGRKLDPEQHTVELENGEKILWEKLLLAVGGNPTVPRIPGVTNSNVFTFTTLEDAKKLDQFLNNGETAVVIGGGLIGVSATEALVKRGAQVTVVEMKDRLLNTILDETASRLFQDRLQQAGVRVLTNHTVSRILGGGKAESVLIDDREGLPCDLVVVAIGVSPRIELVSDTGIKVNRGIVVDRHMMTSSPDIYCCGDAAEAYDYVYGTGRATAIWPNAYVGGRVAGYNMVGTPAEYAGGTTVSTLNYFGLSIAAAGMSVPEGEGYEVLHRQNNGCYQKIIIRDNLVKGMTFVGDIEKSGIVYSLIREQVNVAEFKQLILGDDFGLSVLPREFWQKRLNTTPAVIERR